ncbi:MAG: hypothetical protein IT479_08645 [Xanthomonadales bacterium]|nr:hypothetical protein [Xanthomonadales bacterium]MCC6593330.1 hypothetical protein [Xanthomonadales bacterium]MCE7930433.1 hypothetical protein [Xanthomonadales bacterium PRO6]
MYSNYLATLPQFALLYAAGLLLLAAFWALYTWVTPHDELAPSAALMPAGAMLGCAHRLRSHAAILQDRISVALWAATISLCAGILNAGAQFV